MNTRRRRSKGRTKGRTKSRTKGRMKGRMKGGFLSYVMSKGASIFSVDPVAPAGNPSLPVNPFSYFQGE